jgi:hypothetical protein
MGFLVGDERLDALDALPQPRKGREVAAIVLMENGKWKISAPYAVEIVE